MARSKTVTVTIRLPVGIVAILNDAVERGMFASTSDAVRSLIGRSLQVTSQDAVGGPIRGMGIGSNPEFAPSTMNAMNQYDDAKEEFEEQSKNEQSKGGEVNRSKYWFYKDKKHYILRQDNARGVSRWITHSN